MAASGTGSAEEAFGPLGSVVRTRRAFGNNTPALSRWETFLLRTFGHACRCDAVEPRC